MSKNCKICNGETHSVFQAVLLNKYTVAYFQCLDCDFIQTETPYWLEESYSSAITFLDIGLVSRNTRVAEKLACIINMVFNASGKFIDYAGGYGMLVRLMRDKGYDFYRADKYCENLFAKTFDITDQYLIGDRRYELVTAFEVFEHLDNPLEEIRKMLEYSNNILFSTELQPEKAIKDSTDWWYIAPEMGQHIAFYTEKSLNVIAKKMGVKYYKINNNLHLFSDKDINIKRITTIINNSKLSFLYKKLFVKNRKSFLPSDYNTLIGRKVL